MKHIKLIIAILLTISGVMIMYSCTFENEESYFGVCEVVNEYGDTVDVYYDELKPIFEGICANCHNTTSTYRKGIVMDSYNNVKSSFNELVPGTSTPKIIRAITHTGPYKMPNGQPKLSECEIDKIKIWLINGLPETETQK